MSTQPRTASRCVILAAVAVLALCPVSTSNDVFPSILSGPTVTTVTDTSFTVAWETDVPCISILRYGVSASARPAPVAVVDVLEFEVIDSAYATQHELTATGLAPSTEYEFEVAVIDTAGNGETVSVRESVATTNGEYPVIVSGPVVSATTATSFTIAWETDEPCISIMRYVALDSLAAGRPAALGDELLMIGDAIVDSAYVTQHELTATGLIAGAQYVCHVAAVDSNGNGETISTEVFVTTQEEVDLTPPVVLTQPAVVSMVLTDDNTINVAIVWTTDEPAVGRVAFGRCEPLELYGIAVSDAGPTSTHEIQLTNLVPDTRYCYAVRATDLAGNISDLTHGEFRTPAGPDTLPPVLTTQPIILGITHSSITVGWMTDEPATAVVEYGTTDSLGGTLVDHSLSTEHRITITQLAAGTQYYVRVRCTDAVGNVTLWASPEPIRTRPAPDVLPPTFLSGPIVEAVSDTFAVIQWRSDELANFTIRFGTIHSTLNHILHTTDYNLEHRVMLSELTPATHYVFEIEMHDLEGNGAVAIPLQFYTKESPLSVAESVPTAFALRQNAPNPFNPSTTISFSLPNAGRAVMTIYNAGGQHIRTLVDAHVTAGVHAVDWDGRNSAGEPAASGMYICRLRWQGMSRVNEIGPSQVHRESRSDSRTNTSAASVRRLLLVR